MAACWLRGIQSFKARSPRFAVMFEHALRANALRVCGEESRYPSFRLMLAGSRANQMVCGHSRGITVKG